MKCKDVRVVQILVGLHKVGIVGLRDALKAAEQSDLEDRREVVDFLVETLAPENYFPPARDELLRAALWREFLRHTGKNFSEFYTEIPVTVRGDAGQERDRFVEMTRSVFAGLELKPVVSLETPDRSGPNPQLIVNDETIVRGLLHRNDFKTAVHKSVSGW